ncbi:hypothetical protein BS47DRAFT_260802 [Hydnum rufescens UP504]|uniref:Secreted protein n=1 Tax=Hydnum rufescens UP504 TaxID=1448309 RepID=A0A9P6DYJ2_9AGAM|nr:hypothetical protein BS47DRAFT_260802 [Hydnum rufescens UP504]
MACGSFIPLRLLLLWTAIRSGRAWLRGVNTRTACIVAWWRKMMVLILVPTPSDDEHHLQYPVPLSLFIIFDPLFYSCSTIFDSALCDTRLYTGDGIPLFSTQESPPSSPKDWPLSFFARLHDQWLVRYDPPPHLQLIYSCKAVRSSIQIFFDRAFIFKCSSSLWVCIVMFSRWLRTIRLFVWLPIQCARYFVCIIVRS